MTQFGIIRKTWRIWKILEYVKSKIDLPWGFFGWKLVKLCKLHVYSISVQCFTSSKVLHNCTKNQSGEKQEWPIGLKHSRHTRTFLWFAWNPKSKTNDFRSRKNCRVASRELRFDKNSYSSLYLQRKKR